MEASWSDFLSRPDASEHAAQVYAHPDELAESVAGYLAAGFALGDPAVVIATPEHTALFVARLAEAGWDADDLERQGLLVVADAETTLAAVMGAGGPSATRFEGLVGGLIEGLNERYPGRAVRAFGEMVDLLCARGNENGAVALEALWNRLAQRRRFSLLCGYGVDVFDRRAQLSVMPGVCHAHSHVLPAPDPARLERAVGAALEAELGTDSGAIYALVAGDVRRTRVPVAQLLLMWVSAHMPSLSERVLASAQANYLRG